MPEKMDKKKFMYLSDPKNVGAKKARELIKDSMTGKVRVERKVHEAGRSKWWNQNINKNYK